MTNVLLIEPNHVLAATYSQALEHAGYKVVCAGSAQAGLDEADKLTPDMVIIEPQTGAHNGIEFLQEFRSYDDWQAVPVIINSYILPEVFDNLRVSLGRDFGVTIWLYKPRTTLAQLLSIVKQQVKTE